MNTVKVLSKGQIVIPVGIRKKYEITPGTRIQVFEYDNIDISGSTRQGCA